MATVIPGYGPPKIPIAGLSDTIQQAQKLKQYQEELKLKKQVANSDEEKAKIDMLASRAKIMETARTMIGEFNMREKDPNKQQAYANTVMGSIFRDSRAASDTAEMMQDFARFESSLEPVPDYSKMRDKAQYFESESKNMNYAMSHPERAAALGYTPPQTQQTQPAMQPPATQPVTQQAQPPVTQPPATQPVTHMAQPPVVQPTGTDRADQLSGESVASPGVPRNYSLGDIAGIEEQRRQKAVLTKQEEEARGQALSQSEKDEAVQIASLRVASGKLRTLNGAFKAMQQVSGGAGRLHGLKNIWQGVITGENPYVRPYVGLTVEVAVALAKLAAPSARVGQALLSAFQKSIPDIWSTEDEMYSQIMYSLHNAIDSAAGMVDPKTGQPLMSMEDAELYRSKLKTIGDEMMADAINAPPMTLDRVKSIAALSETAAKTGSIYMQKPDGTVVKVPYDRKYEAIWKGNYRTYIPGDNNVAVEGPIEGGD